MSDAHELDEKTVEVIHSYLRPERALHPKSAAAIEEVLGAAYEQLRAERDEARAEAEKVRRRFQAITPPISEGDPLQESHDRLQGELADALAAAAIMVGTLLDALPDDRREWLNELVERQGQAFPGAERLQRASRAILQEVDAPMSFVRAANAIPCHAPQACPTPDLCSDSEACSWPRVNDGRRHPPQDQSAVGNPAPKAPYPKNFAAQPNPPLKERKPPR